jgi:2-oxoglutarate ferredoxin oxidoreductase subunit delta
MADIEPIEIKKEWCKGCEICVDVCPRDVLEMKDFVAVVKNLDNCTYCNMCELLCPDFAIVIHPPEKKKKVVRE